MAMEKPQTDILLVANDIHKSYGSLEVLRGVNLELRKGEMVSLVGASGAGKSTLLQALGTLDDPDTGVIVFEGRDITALKEEEKAEFRNLELGFVFQFHHLLPEFDALENVCLPAFIAGKNREAAEKRGRELLDFLGLGDRTSHRPSELSGGEQQRVAVARALINHPKLLLADEPTGNLDSKNSENLYELFTQLKKEMGVGILITTHNETLAQAADRRLFMKDGLIMGAEKVG